jgi:branched-chain amino acid transport system substrate-binding protein
MKMPVTRYAVTIGLAGVLVLTAAAAKAAWWSSDTVTLGAAVQLTGNLAGTGRYYRDAYQFMVDKINEKGGISVGGKTYKLALKLLDSKSDSTLGSRLHERMVSKDKVDFLLGPFSSNDVLAGSSVAEKHQVPMIQAGGASSRIFSRGYKYVFGTLPSADDYFRSTIEMLEQLKPEARTVGLVSGDDAFDASLSGATNALLKKAGLEVVLDQQYSERIPNFYNILTLIKSKAPDVFCGAGMRPVRSASFARLRAARSVRISFRPSPLASRARIFARCSARRQTMPSA